MNAKGSLKEQYPFGIENIPEQTKRYHIRFEALNVNESGSEA